MPIDYTQSARTRLLAAVLSSEMYEDIDEALVVFQRVEPGGFFDKNTKILTKITLSGVRVDQFYVYTDRRDLGTLSSVALDAENSNVVWAADLLPVMLSELGVNLELADIIDEPVTEPSYQLKANPNSLGWTGQLEVALGTSSLGFNLLRNQNDSFPTANGLYLRIR